MGNPLFGVNISKIIADAIGPGVLDATLTRVSPGTRTPGQLTGGTNPTTASYACKGFIDSKDREKVGGTLVKDGSVVVVLIGDTISGGAVSPVVGDKVAVEGTTYVIDGLDRDPAGATFTLLCRKV